MNTINISSASFGAKFINKIPVKKFDSLNNAYKDSLVSFVQIDSRNRKDVAALMDTAKYWRDGHYADNIAYTARELYLGKMDDNHYQVYALTSQKKQFDNLLSEKILGLIELENKPDYAEILHLQVDPELIYTNQPPRYKYVGTGILNFLKKFYNKTLELASVCSAVEFYQKNGFEICSSTSLRFRWKPSKIKH